MVSVPTSPGVAKPRSVAEGEGMTGCQPETSAPMLKAAQLHDCSRWS